jgi:hypothetical protein
MTYAKSENGDDSVMTKKKREKTCIFFSNLFSFSLERDREKYFSALLSLAALTARNIAPKTEIFLCNFVKYFIRLPTLCVCM